MISDKQRGVKKTNKLPRADMKWRINKQHINNAIIYMPRADTISEGLDPHSNMMMHSNNC